MALRESGPLSPAAQGLGLVFVAVYQKALKVLYVDELLEALKSEFPRHYQPKRYDYPAFADSFERLRAQLEAASEPGRRGVQQAPRAAGGRKARALGSLRGNISSYSATRCHCALPCGPSLCDQRVRNRD